MLKKFFITAILVSAWVIPGVTPAFAQGEAPKTSLRLNNMFLQIIEGSATGESTDLKVEDVAARVVAVLISLTGLVFVMLMIYGGYLWGTARGNTERVETGRKLIFEATIGVIIIFGAFLLTAFIIQSVGEASLQNNWSYYYN
jgi:hypothetical protein